MARPYIAQSSPAAEVRGRGAFLCTSFLSASGSQQTSRPQIGQQLIELSDHIQLSGGIGHSRRRRNFPGRARRTSGASGASGPRCASRASGTHGTSHAIRAGGTSRASHTIGASGTSRASHTIRASGTRRASYAIGAGGCNHICATPTKSVLSFPLSNTV